MEFIAIGCLALLLIGMFIYEHFRLKAQRESVPEPSNWITEFGHQVYCQPGCETEEVQIPGNLLREPGYLACNDTGFTSHDCGESTCNCIDFGLELIAAELGWDFAETSFSRAKEELLRQMKHLHVNDELMRSVKSLKPHYVPIVGREG